MVNVWVDVKKDKISLEGVDMVAIMMVLGRLVVQEVRYLVVYVDGWSAWQSMVH